MVNLNKVSYYTVVVRRGWTQLNFHSMAFKWYISQLYVL